MKNNPLQSGLSRGSFLGFKERIAIIIICVTALCSFGACGQFLPRTPFDWVVVMVGCIAIVSGIILMLGLIGFLSKGLKKKKIPPKTLHDLFPKK